MLADVKRSVSGLTRESAIGAAKQWGGRIVAHHAKARPCNYSWYSHHWAPTEIMLDFRGGADIGTLRDFA